MSALPLQAEASTVIQFFSQILKFPAAAVAAGFEIVARIIQDVQQTFDRSVDVVAEGMAQTLRDTPAETGISSGTSSKVGQAVMQNGVDNGDRAAQSHGGNMGDWDGPDQDLSGDDLKVVRYRIIFTKRDYEAKLAEGEETINYSTNGGSLGGLKVAKFLGEVEQHLIPRPQIWCDNNYPEDAVDERHWKVPADDLRYITFLYEVIRKVEKEEKDYDKEQVRILGQIRNRL